MWTHLKSILPLTLGLALAAFLVLDVTAGKEGPPDPVAEIDGRAVAWEELQEHVAAELQQLEIQRHQLLESALDTLVEQRLLEAEAARRGLSPEDLLEAEVASAVEAVTDEQVDAWYQENQARVRAPKEQVAGQIREHLRRQRLQAKRAELLTALRQRFEVVRHLEPMRVELTSEGAPAKGPAGAPVTLVEFSDFQCPYCARINPTLDTLRERYGDRLRVVFRQFPLRQIHPQAQKAAEAALCAADQGKFWQLHDALFADQGRLTVADLEARAEEVGLNADSFGECLASGEKAAAVQADLEAGHRVGVSGTPSIFVNGRPVELVSGRSPVDQLAEVIEDELRRSGS